MASIDRFTQVGSSDSLDSKAFYNCIFSPDGKIQRAGTPIDEYKVLSVRDGVLPGYKEIRSEVHGSLAQLAPHRPAGRRHGDANRRHGLHLHRLRGSCQVEVEALREGHWRDIMGAKYHESPTLISVIRSGSLVDLDKVTRVATAAMRELDT